MAHAHHHAEDRSSYFLDQLFAIAVCGSIAGVTLMLWQGNLLGKILHPKFHIWVILGAFCLLAVVILRAIAVWRAAEPQPAEKPHGRVGDDASPNPSHGHSHSHGHAHSHGHTHSHAHSHSHANGHDHGWAPWRYVVLLLPVALYFLILSNPAFDREPVELPSHWWADATSFNKNLLDAIINFVVIFRSILWEALPFIILGAIIAGLLEELLPQRFITAVLPKNRAVAVGLGGLLGLVFPMCECGIIPIMRRLLRKGLPLSCCIAYLLAGPVINVVVLLSTFAALSGMENVFEGGQPSYQMGGWWMMGLRALLAYVTAVVTALIVERVYQKYGDSLLTPLARPSGLPLAEDDTAAKRPLWERVNNISETAMHDFIDITVFLILGALLAATVRLFLSQDDIASLGREHITLAILAMMGLAIILCLCSEADAFVAASFVTLRPSAKLAFLVLGPMMDLKLYAMYTRIFRPRLIFTIYTSVLVQVFVYSLGVHWFWETYKERLITPVQQKVAHVSEQEAEAWSVKAATAAGLLAAAPPGGSIPDQVLAAWATLLLNASDEAPEIRFTQLESAALSPDLREFYQGKRVSIIGRFRGQTEESFLLTRYRINCCAADAQPLKVVFYVAPEAKQTIPLAKYEGKWVRVTGQVQFLELPPGSKTFHPAMRIMPTEREPLSKLIEEVPPPANIYVE